MPKYELPPIKNIDLPDLGYFPNSFYAAVFRLWETVPADRIAAALEVSCDVVKKAAEAMGLPPQQHTDIWDKRGYITTIKNAWHILPYNQLVKALGWSEERLANALKEEDFLCVKLGNYKPRLEQVKYTELTPEQMVKLDTIKTIVTENLKSFSECAAPFDFFTTDNSFEGGVTSDTNGLRMIYSYCGLYGNVLEQDISLSYPESLLKMYSDAGVNAIWLPVVLYQMVPFPFDEHYSKGYELRQERLRQLIKTADKYGIKVILYLNEPRCMPLVFFDEHPQLLGTTRDQYGALCSDRPEVLEYLKYAVRTLCESVKGIGGFFAITCSEYLTHCKSNMCITPCKRCEGKSTGGLISEILTAIYNESTAVDKNIKTIAWTWAWTDFMSIDEIKECISSLPKGIIIQTNSEAKSKFTIGGISGEVDDYSMSIPGPSDLAKVIWQHAVECGHEVSAKVQVNDTWECSTVPYIPVFDLIREHMTGLKECNVKHLMLSWTLGGYPSINLKIASECLKDPSPESYKNLLKQNYGEYAELVEKASSVFSSAFREFPFHIDSLYQGPQNGGPANLIYHKPTGINSTMTGYTFDDIDSWRSIYPREVYVSQFKKLYEGWRQGIELIADMPECEFKDVSYGVYSVFSSSYNQSAFVMARESGDTAEILRIAEEEKGNAKLMLDLMCKSSLFGYEAANHYYFNKTNLLEKLINCNYVINEIQKYN